MKRILILFLIFVCCLTTVNASENITNDDLNLADSQDHISIENEKNSSNDFLSVGESADNPVNNTDELWLSFFRIPQSSTANIYLADNEYSYNNKIFDSPKNVTFIGQGPNTILKGISTQAGAGVAPSEKNYAIPYTFVNLTFVGGSNDLSRSCKFINCTIIDSLTFSKDFHDHPDKLNIRHTTQDYYALRTYFYEFDNCIFKDYKGNDSYLTLYQYGCASFNNCNFTNITADSIICYANDVSFERIKSYLLKLGWSESEIERISYDGINFNDCIFKDTTYTAVTDSYTAVKRSIVNCSNIKSEYYGVFTTDSLHQYYSLPIPINTTLTIRTADIVYGEPFIISAVFNNPICDDVIVVINKNKYTINVIGGEGLLKVSDELDAGFWNIQADSIYNNFNYTSNFTVKKINTKLSVPTVSSVYNDAKYLTVTLKDYRNNALNNALVSVKIDSNIHNIKTVNGQARILINDLIPKNYKVVVTYNGDANHFESSSNSNIVISKATPKLTAKKATFKTKKKTKKYSIILKDNKNKALSKVKVTLKVKGKTYKATTNTKGKATFKITKLNKKGTFTAKISFKGNAYYKSCGKTIKIKIK
ncbi:hypothetical protein MBBTH_17540 [Methanobrevibacter thaueri]|uniref:Bacterial Ig-like domain (Group 1) n=1 Tax=Methanobrevibacter thaueri TaxID=190975 RepID=A0A315Y7E9_9EURY|nr:hypothetical protein MBBTH_17540 [Methanobrevibacter thaueri]